MKNFFIKLKVKVTKSKFRIFLVIVFLSFIVYNAILVRSHHHIRVSLQKIIETNDKSFLSLNPDKLHKYFRWEDKQIIQGYFFSLPDTIRKKANTIEKAIKILNYLGVQNAKPDLILTDLPEDPSQIQKFFLTENLRGSCYNDAITFSTILQREGYYTRIIGLDSDDGIAGKGHNVVDVWIDSINKWIFFDPQQSIYITNNDREYLSVLELRDNILNSKNQKEFDNKVVVHKGEGAIANKDSIFKYYLSVVQDINFYLNNDFYTESKLSFSRKLSGFIEDQFSIFGKYTIWVGRMVRSLYGNQFTRIRFLDDHNNISYRPNFWYYIYRIFYWAWIISILCTIYIMSKHFIRKLIIKHKP